MHLEILDDKRRKMISQLTFLNKYGFYLAGGTALALHLGHRTSVDFDFYTPKSFNPDDVIADFEKISDSKAFMIKPDTLGLIVNNQIEVTFFKYNYPLIWKMEKLEKIKIASVPDIAAMKIAAIIQRGTQRDFIDIYYLIKQYGLEKILDWTKEKYPHVTLPLCLKGLVYFQDADIDKKSKERIMIFDRNFSWKKAKDYIEKKVFEFQKNSVK